MLEVALAETLAKLEVVVELVELEVTTKTKAVLIEDDVKVELGKLF